MDYNVVMLILSYVGLYYMIFTNTTARDHRSTQVVILGHVCLLMDWRWNRFSPDRMQQLHADAEGGIEASLSAGLQIGNVSQSKGHMAAGTGCIILMSALY